MSPTTQLLDPQRVVKVDDIETVVYRAPAGALEGLKFSGGQGTVEKVEKVPFQKPEVHHEMPDFHWKRPLMQSKGVCGKETPAQRNAVGSC